jgi:hypothetical protein
MMSAFQSGMNRGRRDAENTADNTGSTGAGASTDVHHSNAERDSL